MTRGFKIGPGIEAGISGIHRDGVELPLQLSGFRIERLQESGRIDVVSGTDQQMIVDNDRRHRRKVLLIEVRDLHVPAFHAGPGIERHQVIIGRFEIEIVVPDADAAIGDVRGAARLPVVVPDLVSVAGIEHPDVVGRRDIQMVIDHENAAFDRHSTAGAEFSGSRRRPSIRLAPRPARGSGSNPADPCQREILHRVLVRLLQRAETTAGVIAGVCRPCVAERFQQRCGIESALCLSSEQCRRDHQHTNQNEFSNCHFRVTRYAVTS